MSEKNSDSVSSMYAAYKNGDISRNQFMSWLIEANEEGGIDDAEYQKYSDIVDCDVFADNDIPTLD